MAKPNYAFAKRQRELAKKQKLEEKRLRKASGAPDLPDDDSGEGTDAVTPSDAPDAAPAPGPTPSGA